jgi:DNA polymerase-3 subunit chi
MMTTQVDFYLIGESHNDGRYRIACRLLEKAYHQHHKAFVLCETQALAQTMDELLWTYADTSFVPHNLLGEGPTPPPPIQMGTQVPPHHHDILFLLSETIPPEFRQFKRVIEIIHQDERAKQIGREHYRYFREQGCPLTSHDLQKKVESEPQP